MVSQVDVVNMALAEIGAASISDIDEEAEQAVKAKLYYDPVRDSLLRAYPWTFALKQWSCAPVNNAEAFKNFKYSFLKPVDCLRFLRSADHSECECAGKYIRANVDILNIIGISRIEDENLFDPIFVEVFVLKLAQKLSIVLSNDKGIRDRLSADYNNLIKTAQVKSALEGPDQEYEYISTWLNARII